MISVFEYTLFGLKYTEKKTFFMVSNIRKLKLTLPYLMMLSLKYLSFNGDVSFNDFFSSWYQTPMKGKLKKYKFNWNLCN